jgi:hypothetical protein
MAQIPDSPNRFQLRSGRLAQLSTQQRLMLGGIVTLAAGGLAVLAIAAFATWFFMCPCERTPGAYLHGEQAEAAVADWGFANEVPLCQIETRSGILPHAINLNCAADQQGQLFLSCSQCEGKRWSTAALENPAARIRLNGVVYPITLRRLGSASELDHAWRVRAEKLAGLNGSTLDQVPPRPDHWWSFEVTSRS